MSDAEIARQLKIKTGIVKRLRKELALYQQEQKDHEAKVQTLKDEGADPHDIKYAEKILSESAAMIPDTQQRLESAFNDLQSLVEECSTSHPSEEFNAATQELEDAKAIC